MTDGGNRAKPTPRRLKLGGIVLIVVMAILIGAEVRDVWTVGFLSFYSERPIRILAVIGLTLLVASIVLVGERILCRLTCGLKPPRSLLCRMCGPDITGNVSGVCPECGVKR